MAPSAVDPPAQTSEPDNTVRPAHLYTPRETRFERYLEPQPNGYRQAKSRGPERATIVIDNGNPIPALRQRQDDHY